MYIAYNPALLDWDGYQLPHIQRPSTGFSSCVDVRLATSHLLSWLSIQYASGLAWRQCKHPGRWWFGKCPSFHIWQFWVSLLSCRGGKLCTTFDDASQELQLQQAVNLYHLWTFGSPARWESGRWFEFPGHGNNPITYLDETFWMEIVPFLVTQWPRWLPLVASQRGLKRSTS